MDYYDRNGAPLTLAEWSKRIESRAERRVAETTLPDGKWVSTVWLGLGLGLGRPLIFETMVFPKQGECSCSLDCERYSTETEALAGHAAMVTKWGRGGEAA